MGALVDDEEQEGLEVAAARGGGAGVRKVLLLPLEVHDVAEPALQLVPVLRDVLLVGQIGRVESRSKGLCYRGHSK